MSRLTIEIYDDINQMDKLVNDLKKSSIKNEKEVGFKTPPRNMIPKQNVPPSIKKEYFEARLKRRRSVISNLNDLGNQADDERELPKVNRYKFPNLGLIN
jgi:hypothetical protein